MFRTNTFGRRLGRDHAARVKPQDAADKAFKRVEEMFAKDPIAQI